VEDLVGEWEWEVVEGIGEKIIGSVVMGFWSACLRMAVRWESQVPLRNSFGENNFDVRIPKIAIKG
jgi:hypothetical protein